VPGEVNNVVADSMLAPETDAFEFILRRIPRGLLRGFYALAKSVLVGAKFRNTLSACGGDRNFEDFASLLPRKYAHIFCSAGVCSRRNLPARCIVLGLERLAGMIISSLLHNGPHPASPKCDTEISLRNQN